MLNITGNLLPALNVLNGLPVVLDLALGLGEDLLQLVHLALQLGLKGELHVVECESARGQLVPGESNLIDGEGIVILVRYLQTSQHESHPTRDRRLKLSTHMGATLPWPPGSRVGWGVRGQKPAITAIACKKYSHFLFVLMKTQVLLVF